MHKTNIPRSIFAMILTLALIFQMSGPILAFAATNDRDTTVKYTESLGENASTEYAGRVWTDKSVFTNNVRFDTYGGGSATVHIDANAGEDFLISYSALATSQAISGQSHAPVDVVLILDISGSMSNEDSNMDNGKSRIHNTVQAANNAIEELMTLNPHTRVAVAAFSSNAQVLLPLDRYEKTTEIKRQWVQTGRFDGYWDEVEVEVPYLSVNRDTASDYYADMTVKAIRESSNATISKTVDVQGGTNIQMGLYEGMHILATEESTRANINGAQVQRVPSVILLSDGAPTYSSNSQSWWAPNDNSNDGPGSAPYAGNGMKAILVGAYMKDAIDRNYGVAGTAYATTVYTVGMGITGLSDSEKNLANMTLNPGYYWNNTRVTNSMKTTIKGYWESYTARNNTGTLNINVGQNDGWMYTDKDYALTHPTTGYDVDSADGYDYVDDYYSADNASAVTDVFSQIVSNISITAPSVPTEIKGSDPLTDGYITYTDPIGQYMEVKDVKSIIYAGNEFTQKAVTTANGVTTYTFSGEVHSPVYGDQEIKNIIITVSADNSGNETLTIKIPASVIPLRVNEVTLNADGSVKSHTNNGAYPARVVYSVGMKDSVRKTADDGHAYVDATQLSPEYVTANTNPNGNINFYSNIYTGANKLQDGTTVGNAIVEFEPNHANPFYYIQEDMPIYKDVAFQSQVTEAEGLDDNTVYYYKDVYYHGAAVEARAIARTGKQLKQTAITTGSDGFLYRAAGSPRLNRMMAFEGTKVENATGTAQDFYAPTFQHAPGNPDPYAGKIVVYLGNNGVLDLPAGGNLQIRKDVTAQEGITAPDKTFTFTIDLDGSRINNGVYTYIVRDAAQNQVRTGTVSKNSNTIALRGGETATIYSLPPQTTFAVTEAAEAGFSTQAVGASGTIHAGTTQSAVFTNNYAVTAVTTANLEGKKILSGRDWAAGDSFTFYINPYNNGPLPAGYDAANGVTVTAPDVAGGDTATFQLGSITFAAPGTYRYIVAEQEPDHNGYLPGITYSRALYRLVYVVEDNGSGVLTINETLSGIQKLYDDNANQLFSYDSNNQIVMNPGQEAADTISFTNTYAANSVVRVPVAMKAYADPSGTKPLVSGMFRFRLKALGYQVDDGQFQSDITNVPMPAGSQNGESITTNEGHEITFPAVEFKQDMIPASAQKITYRYEMSEVIPADGDKIPGMAYDNTTYTVDVVVEIDPNHTDLKVSANFPAGMQLPTFTNSFALEGVSAAVNGTKTLNGRAMHSGESFSFTLANADAATNNAVRDGYVVVPNRSASVSGGKDGEKIGFSFADIRFNRPGTYTFLVSETAGTAPGVTYDDSHIAVTFEIADTNGDAKLEVVSTTYSGGGTSADFVNTYQSTFGDTPVSLNGTKNLTGKALVAGEFYFKVETHFNGTYVNDYLVTHTADDVASNGVFSGQINFLDEVIYDTPGTYTYYISEQIPSGSAKVHGTQYDGKQYRFTVVVADNNQGELLISSQKLEESGANGWVNANSVVFNNVYTPDPTTAYVPLIKKILSGDREMALQTGEFSFTMAVLSATSADGITLPNPATVMNAANGDVAFGSITFTEPGTYTVQITEDLPANVADRAPGVSYSTKQILATFEVTDDRVGNLTATLTQFTGDTFINEYVKQPTEAVITGKKVLQGGTLNANDFSFHLYETDSSYSIGNKQPLKTLSNAADGTFTFDKTNVSALNYTDTGIYHYVLVEDTSAPVDGIHYDTNAYRFQVTVTDNNDGTLKATVSCVNGDVNNIVFRNITHDQIVKKDVALATAPAVSIDGKQVQVGQILRYTINYTNLTDADVDVTITDTIPAHTKLHGTVAGGTVNGDAITWTFAGVAPRETVSVTFQVEVVDPGTVIENQARIFDGTNKLTNKVTNAVPGKTVDSTDVTIAKAQAVGSGAATTNKLIVNSGDIVTYFLTVTNNGKGDAYGITVTDVVPKGLGFVSAQNGGVEANGTVTWTLAQLAAGQSTSVTFKVKVPSVEQTTTWTNIASLTYENNPEGADTVIESNQVMIEEKVTVTPDTGDKFNPAAFFTMMVLSSFGLAAVITCKQREEAQEAE